MPNSFHHYFYFFYQNKLKKYNPNFQFSELVKSFMNCLMNFILKEIQFQHK